MGLTNGQLAELLARAAEAEDRGTNRHRALVRASRAALLWPEEAADLLASGRSITELRAVGPWVGGIVAGWFERAEDLEPVEPPPLRRDRCPPPRGAGLPGVRYRRGDPGRDPAGPDPQLPSPP